MYIYHSRCSIADVMETVAIHAVFDRVGSDVITGRGVSLICYRV